MTHEAMLCTADLVATLDDRYKTWDLYRLMGRAGWGVRLDDADRHETVSGETIDDALRQAVAFRFLPKIPARTTLILETQSLKDGNGGWRSMALVRPGEWQDIYCASFKTKKEADRNCALAAERNKAAIDAWDKRFASIVASGVEGKDFVYG